MYLKNCVGKYWKDREPEDVVAGGELPYCIPEQAKALIRDNIIGAIIQSPTLIWWVIVVDVCGITSRVGPLAHICVSFHFLVTCLHVLHDDIS